MMHVRFNLLTSDPDRLAESVSFIESEVRDRVQRRPGNLGLSLYTNPVLGTAVVESFWVSEDALRASEQTVSSGRRQAARLGTGTVAVERFQLPVFEREAPPEPGAGRLRLTRMDVEHCQIEDAVEAFGDTVVPWLAETAGICSTLLLVDPGTGRSISESVWRDQQALAASRGVAAAMRADFATSTDCAVRAVEEYGQVFNSSWKPRS
jgi:quinol monooxygenase YgiN